jgi:hypothetical protein
MMPPPEGEQDAEMGDEEQQDAQDEDMHQGGEPPDLEPDDGPEALGAGGDDHVPDSEDGDEVPAGGGWRTCAGCRPGME